MKKLLLLLLLLCPLFASAQILTLNPTGTGSGSGSITNLTPLAASLYATAQSRIITNFTTLFTNYTTSASTNFNLSVSGADATNGWLRTTNDGFYYVGFSANWRFNILTASDRTNVFGVTTNVGSPGTNFTDMFVTTSGRGGTNFFDTASAGIIFCPSNTYITIGYYSVGTQVTNDLTINKLTLTSFNVPGSTLGGTITAGFSGISTNANQFGANTTLSIKDGALLTNIVNWGTYEVTGAQTNRSTLGVAGNVYVAGHFKGPVIITNDNNTQSFYIDGASISASHDDMTIGKFGDGTMQLTFNTANKAVYFASQPYSDFGRSAAPLQTVWATNFNAERTITLEGVTASRVLFVNSTKNVTNVTSADPANDFVHADGSVGVPGAGGLTLSTNSFHTNTAAAYSLNLQNYRNEFWDDFDGPDTAFGAFLQRRSPSGHTYRLHASDPQGTNGFLMSGGRLKQTQNLDTPFYLSVSNDAPTHMKSWNRFGASIVWKSNAPPTIYLGEFGLIVSSNAIIGAGGEFLHTYTDINGTPVVQRSLTENLISEDNGLGALGAGTYHNGRRVIYELNVFSNSMVLQIGGYYTTIYNTNLTYGRGPVAMWELFGSVTNEVQPEIESIWAGYADPALEILANSPRKIGTNSIQIVAIAAGTLTDGTYTNKAGDMVVGVGNGTVRTNKLYHHNNTFGASVRVFDSGRTASGTNIIVETMDGSLIYPGASVRTNISVDGGGMELTRFNGGWTILSPKSPPTGGTGGTNFPPVIDRTAAVAGATGTNITIGTGVRQHVTWITNASFGINLNGIPVRGDTVRLTVSNTSAATIYFTNFTNSAISGVFYPPYASNVTAFAVAPTSIYTVELVAHTNFIANQQFRWEVQWESGFQYELLAGNGTILRTNAGNVFVDAHAVLTNLVATVAKNVTNENSAATQIDAGTLTLSPGNVSNLVNNTTIDFQPGNIVTNVIAQKWNIWTNYVNTVSNFVFTFNTNRYELKNQTNVIFTNIVEEATAVGADMAVHVHNTTGVTMGLVWPAYGAQHGYFFQTNINNPILTSTTLTTGKHGVASFTAFGTNIFATWTEWP